jgi:hypothetical protein
VKTSTVATAVTATNLEQFLIAVGETFTQVQETKPLERMHAVADQIAVATPTLVSLQELAQWFTAPYDPVSGTCGATTLVFDMLAELLKALADKGVSYFPVQAQQFSLPLVPGILPGGGFLCGGMVNNNAVLVRSDLDPTKFNLKGTQSGQFAAKFTVTTPVGKVEVPSAWVYVDASFNGTSFRFIDTHLDTNSALHRLQADELRAGPANASIPVIVAMDSNSKPQQDPTYSDFITAGWADAWVKTSRNSAGLTCCQSEFVDNPVSTLSERIDLVLTLGGVVAQNVALFGNTQDSKTPDGLWPSDHAGVGAQLLVLHDVASANLRSGQ